MIGGGFIGSEVAAGLSSTGSKVTLVFPEAGIGARLFPADLAESVNELYRGHGVEVLPGRVRLRDRVRRRRATSCGSRADGGSRPTPSSRGSGSSPQPSSPRRPGLAVSDGIVVDECGHAGDTGDVWAAGDVARFPAKVLGTEIRVEHEDQANSHGRAVGANMAGRGQALHAICRSSTPTCSSSATRRWGRWTPRKETVAQWAEPFRKGVVAYLDEERRPRGFLLVDVWGKVDAGDGADRGRRAVRPCGRSSTDGLTDPG